MKPIVTMEISSHLTKSYTKDKAFRSLKQNTTKSPCPHGMPTLFYQNFWHIVVGDIIDIVLKTFNNGGNLSYLSKTFIVIIPKIKSAKIAIEFRPIILSIVTYKLVSKVIVNRLKDILPVIIHYSQSAFVLVG